MLPLPSAQQLRYLITLSELRHFGRAAAACAVTQSTLSAGIMTLERQLDAQLLDRTVGKKVVFTPLGQEVARKGRQALEALEAVPQLAAAARTPLTGPLRLGVIPTIGPFLVTPMVRTIQERFPQIVLSVTEDTTERLLEKLSLGRLDLLILAMPCLCDGTETLPLWRDPLQVIMPEGHPLASASHVSAEQLEDQRMIMMEDGHCLREQTLAVCRQGRGWDSSDENDATFTATSLHTMADMVALGLGIGVVPTLAIDNGLLSTHPVISRPLSGGPVWRTIGLAWRPRSPRSADFHTLAAAFSTLAPAAE
ncbi:MULTISPECIES: hydrogen peroxide-inducible genes activator [Acetobacter]|uniref:Hydrogen peroxide-inducible genes activator n=1 Tax=Acetobacter thailandicus TaxID=1502842 RepID=A0ABT3QDC8_9PROT|nr:MULTISPECIES: hydrogen peroxide-inducible genes activator [Acetobacter]MBS0960280.1 hydrogen peroxide-inducible genes activator [Acetobacter thailandicus]MBS0979701.1 hydrogen peroxide-inducible genes activator [Acetobacter thailandicus]MBS0985495.1 hydrogen peroxide-inducible genes activator [Acetobacter thailandicus]MBS1003218.1 hydrogen peroxide-inducible genes activator [Acetobacter thailandicus]MCX2563270.1 hydrogen peroxide-inducible genes activator [Acetobacter thailandicus]